MGQVMHLSRLHMWALQGQQGGRDSYRLRCFLILVERVPKKLIELVGSADLVSWSDWGMCNLKRRIC